MVHQEVGVGRKSSHHTRGVLVKSAVVPTSATSRDGGIGSTDRPKESFECVNFPLSSRYRNAFEMPSSMENQRRTKTLLSYPTHEPMYLKNSIRTHPDHVCEKLSIEVIPKEEALLVKGMIDLGGQNR